MLLPDEKYQDSGIAQDYCLASISDFNSLIAKSQEHQVPVFLLSDQQIRLTGPLLQRTRRSRNMFKGIFSKMADMVVTLTDDARNS